MHAMSTRCVDRVCCIDQQLCLLRTCGLVLLCIAHTHSCLKPFAKPPARKGPGHVGLAAMRSFTQQTVLPSESFLQGQCTFAALERSGCTHCLARRQLQAQAPCLFGHNVCLTAMELATQILHPLLTINHGLAPEKGKGRGAREAGDVGGGSQGALQVFLQCRAEGASGEGGHRCRNLRHA